MVYGIGTDIVEVSRIQEAIEKYKDKFLNRIFTEAEIAYCETYKDTKFVHYAARFAAKESFSKAIGTGITKGFKFREFGILNDALGKPIADISGTTADKYGKYKFHISLSHTAENAIAYIIMED